MNAEFPLWGRETGALAQAFLDEGFRAIVVCVDLAKLDRHWAGRAYDAKFLAELPAGIDPCGENGEFHTFVYDGPIFHAPVPVRRGIIVERDGFAFADLVAAPQ
jgi:diphthamide synthase (EF-2-diphthine--ammonia ligase)